MGRGGITRSRDVYTPITSTSATTNTRVRVHDRRATTPSTARVACLNGGFRGEPSRWRLHRFEWMRAASRDATRASIVIGVILR